LKCPWCGNQLHVVSPLYCYFPVKENGEVDYHLNPEVATDTAIVATGEEEFIRCRNRDCGYENDRAVSGGEVIPENL